MSTPRAEPSIYGHIMVVIVCITSLPFFVLLLIAFLKNLSQGSDYGSEMWNKIALIFEDILS